MAKSERARLVAEGVEQLRQLEAQRKDVIVENIVDEDPAARPEGLAETIALLVAGLRAVGSNSVDLCVEVALTASPAHREELLEARATLAALGYSKVAEVLKRLARKAKPRPQRWVSRREAMRLAALN